jgi:hypothetical protein
MFDELCKHTELWYKMAFKKKTVLPAVNFRVESAIIRGWQYWLSRRSHKSAMPWDQFKQLLEAFPLPTPKIVHSV